MEGVNRKLFPTPSCSSPELEIVRDIAAILARRLFAIPIRGAAQNAALTLGISLQKAFDQNAAAIDYHIHFI